MPSGLHVDGNFIKDSNGNAYFLKSFSTEINRTLMVLTQAQMDNKIQYMRNMGADCIRFMVPFGDIENGILNNSTFWSNLKHAIATADSLGMIIVLSGTGVFWSNYSSPYAHYVDDYFNAPPTTGYTWSTWISWWQQYATELLSYGNVIFHLLGEPLNVSDSDYITHMRNCIDAIRTIDANRVICVEGNGNDDQGEWIWTFDYELDTGLQRSNICFSIDVYGNNGGGDPVAFLTTCQVPAMISAGKCVIIPEFNGASVDPQDWSETVQNIENALINYAVNNNVGGISFFSWSAYSGSAPYEDAWCAVQNYNGVETANGEYIASRYSVIPDYTSGSTLTLTINNASGGITNPSAGVTEHEVGEEITLTAYPDIENYYYFSYWIINGTAVSNNPYTFNIYTDTVVTPLFNVFTPEGSDISPKLTIALGSVGVYQGDIIHAKVHLGGTKEVSSWELKLQNWNAKYSPSGYYPLSVGQDGYICIGRGSSVPQIITTRTEEVKFESTPLENYATVSGRCWGEKLFRQVVTKTYASQKGEAIVKDLLDYYSGLSHVRDSVELVENTSTTYSLLEYENTPVWDILRAIAESSDNSGVIGYDFRVAPDGKFEFFSRGSKISSVSLSEKIEESLYSKNIFGVRNRVWIFGAADKSVPLDKDAWTESLGPSDGFWSVGAGSSVLLDYSNKLLGSASIKLEAPGSNYYAAVLFTLDSGKEVDANLYPVLNLFLALDSTFSGNIYINLEDTSAVIAQYAGSVSANNKWCQVQVKCGSENAGNWNVGSGFDWSHVKKVTIYCDFPTTGGGNFWVDSMFFGGRRYSSMKEDSTSQSAYGLRMLVDTDEELYSDNECELRAKAVLANKKDPAEYLTVKSTVIDYGSTPLLPGDKISVVLPNEHINGYFRIISVDYEVDSKTQTLTISLELGREVPLLADYMYRLKSKIDHVSRHKIAR